MFWRCNSGDCAERNVVDWLVLDVIPEVAGIQSTPRCDEFLIGSWILLVLNHMPDFPRNVILIK